MYTVRLLTAVICYILQSIVHISTVHVWSMQIIIGIHRVGTEQELSSHSRAFCTPQTVWWRISHHHGLDDKLRGLR